MSVHGSVVATEPCPSCGSRDNVKRYEDGYCKCFGMNCEYYEMPKSEEDESGARGSTVGSNYRSGVDDDLLHKVPLNTEIEYVDLPLRGISSETCRRYKYGVTRTAKGVPAQVAYYGAANKYRLPDKRFVWEGKPSWPLYGQQLWSGGKRLVVTEGEIDALSVVEATNRSWPVVSVPNGAGGARNAIAEAIEFVESFDDVVFMFDMDEPGREAAKACAELLTPGKARIASLPRKDPNEVLLDLGGSGLYQAIFNAAVFRPDGIVEGVDLIEDVLRPPPVGMDYPWACLNPFLHGMRTGEMVCWIAGTGAGKSQVMREISWHIADTHKQRVGYIALEEATRETALGQLSLFLNKPLHIPEVRASVTAEELREASEQVLGQFAFYDHWGSLEAKTLLPKIKYMAHSMGIRWFVLDHLSIMVSGQADEGDERKRIDALTTNLRSLVSELDIGLHVVSHLRRSSGTPHEEGGRISLQDIRGSGAPGQLSNMVVALERNQQAEDATKNHTTLRVLKNRLTGETGVAGVLAYDPVTGRMEDLNNPKGDGFEQSSASKSDFR